MGVADFVRLFAIPIYGLIAYRDVMFRRVPAKVWYPLVGLALLTLGYDGWLLLEASEAEQQLFLSRVGFSVAFLVVLSGLFYYVGFVDETIAKALGLTGLLYPVYPPESFMGGIVPLATASHGVLSLSVVSNAAIVGLLYPLGYAVWNGAHGNFSPVMFTGRVVQSEEVADVHGRLLETTDGYSLSGLDLDAIKEYLKWRGITTSLIRQRPAEIRDPNNIRHASMTIGDTEHNPSAEGIDVDEDDEWGAEQFLDESDQNLDVTAEQLRGALNKMAGSPTLWVSANFPFVVPVFVGLVVVYTAGDLPSLLSSLF